MAMKLRRLLLFSSLAAGLLVCAGLVAQRQSRLSCAVAILSRGPKMSRYLENPGVSYMQAYVRFGKDMPDDVIFGIDQEFVEGVKNPLFIKGGDWAAIVGLQRTGVVWVAIGTTETDAGHASKDRKWKILNLEAPLKPDTWYRLREDADFGARRWKSFTVEGPGIKKTFDLSDSSVDYPNYIPFSGRAMSYYVFAMRGRGMMKVEGNPLTYFDDAEAGVGERGGSIAKVFSDGFERQSTIPKQPLTIPVIDVNRYVQGQWYMERDEALVNIEKVPFARSGRSVCVADPSLK